MADNATTLAWISRSGWGVAHVIDRLGDEYQLTGATHTKTLCGRDVRVDEIRAEPNCDRCKTCTKRA